MDRTIYDVTGEMETLRRELKELTVARINVRIDVITNHIIKSTEATEADRLTISLALNTFAADVRNAFDTQNRA